MLRYGAAWALVLSVTGLHLAAGSIFPETIWGAHHAGFYPGWMQALLYVPVFLVTIAPINAGIRQRFEPLGVVGTRLPVWACFVGVTAAGVWLFASFQVQHHFFGDGLLRIRELDYEMELSGWSYQYDVLIRNRLHHFFKSWWAWEAVRSYAFISISYGAVFLIAGLGIARLLGETQAERMVLFGGLVSSGFALLFFGYAEVYNSVVAATALFLWALLAYVRGRRRLWAPLLTLLAASILHILSLFILPALLYAVLRRHGWDRFWLQGRGHWLKWLIVGSSVAVGGTLFQIARAGWTVPLFEASPNVPYTVFAPAHLLDMANEHLLVALPGWLGLFMGGVVGKARSSDVYLDVLSVAALVSACMWSLVNPALGSLDWDLMALPGPAWVVFGLYFLVLRSRGKKALGYCGLVLVALSLTHTLPWIALQQNQSRAVEALESMVIEDPHMYGHGARGGIAGMLGVRLLREGHDEAARRLMQRVLQYGTADDALTLRTFCQIYMRDKRYDEAEPLLLQVLRILPDRTTLKLLRIFRAQAPDGREKTIGMLEEMINVFPHPTYFGVLAEFYQQEGRHKDLGRLTGQLDQTIGRTEAQAAVSPNSGKVHLSLGALYLRRGRVTEAKSVLLKTSGLELSERQRAAVGELLQVVESLEQTRVKE